jgi:hypothetical protein
MHNILRRWHPMVGCDWHIPHPPPVGIPVWPPSPYLVFNQMTNMLGIELTVLYSPTVLADAMQSNMCRGSDIGMLTPHVGVPSITIAIEMLFGGSKSHFGPMSVSVPDQYGGTQSPAAALMFVVNPNLNCGFPIPTPLGFVIATNTTVTGLTLGDVLAGLYGMAMDFAFQTLINLASHYGLGALFRWIGPKLAPHFGVTILSRAAARRAAREAWKAAGKVGPLGGHVTDAVKNAPIENFTDMFGMIASNPIQFFFGSPLGTDAGAPGIGLPAGYGLGRGLLEKAGLPTEQAVHDWADAPSAQPSGSAPHPDDQMAGQRGRSGASQSALPSSSPTVSPSPAQPSASDPEAAVQDYFSDPSVEEICSPQP